MGAPDRLDAVSARRSRKRRLRARTAFVVAALTTAVAVLGPGPRAWAWDQVPECPPDLDCRFVAAAAGHFAPADRPYDRLRIRYIVIHDTESSYADAISYFTEPGPGVAAHYAVRSADGKVTQFVHNRDVAYHAGNYWFNMHSIGIEHEGILEQGRSWYTEAMYRSSARLVRWLAHHYRIPLDRAHILGHEEVPGQSPATVPGMHYDPGPFWNWKHYFDLLHAPLTGSHSRIPHLPLPLPGPPVVVIAPRFAENYQPLGDCTPTGCAALGRQGSNVVYLRTEPRPEAPLIGDPDLHPDGSPGTTDLGDWSARALTGDPYAVAARAPGWTGIWFAGRLAWFADPDGCVGAPVHRVVVTPLPGRGSIPVYGAAYPELGAYPPGVETTAIVPLRQTIAVGQFYVGLEFLPGDDYAKIQAPHAPDGRVHTPGARRLVEISFNHRRAFVDAADVLILGRA